MYDTRPGIPLPGVILTMNDTFGIIINLTPI